MKSAKRGVKKVGIWLDQSTAFIIEIPAKGDPIAKTIQSGVESRIRFAGETRVSARFGNAFISDQEKKQRRQREQRQKFYKKIIARIADSDIIYLFGPGRAKLGLRNAIKKNTALKGQLLAVDTIDKMTSNQAILSVAEFYGIKKNQTTTQGYRKGRTPGTS